jgi:restriction system protein
MSIESIVKGWTGELQTKLADVLFLDPKEYHSFNNIIIDIGSRTTQIDHIIASKYGVFVIETKNKDGWIFGNQSDPQWTQVFNKYTKYQFQNPLSQNSLHTKSVAEVIGIDHNKIHSVVVFWGKCEFKTQMPPNVLKDNPTGYIKSKKRILISDDEVANICRKLQEIKDNASFLDGWRHTRMLKKRFEGS